jgi:hypothetical protein
VIFDCCTRAVLAASVPCVGIAEVRRSYKSIRRPTTLNPLVAVHLPLMGLRRVYPLTAVTSAGATTSQVTRQFNVLVHKTRSIPFLSSLYWTVCASGLHLQLLSTVICFAASWFLVLVISHVGVDGECLNSEHRTVLYSADAQFLCSGTAQFESRHGHRPS